MSARITRKRTWIAVGTTAYHIPIVAAFVTYFAVQNGKAHDFCFFGWNPRAYTSWQDCALSYDSIIGHWGYWAKVLSIGYTGVSVLMLSIWAGASWLASHRSAARASTPNRSPALASDPPRHLISFEAAAVILVWSLGFASMSGFFPLVSMMLLFALATVFGLVRRVVAAIRKRA